MTTTALKPAKRPQSHSEEWANSFSHGLGFVVVAVLSPFMLMAVAERGYWPSTLGAGVFAASLLFMYASSCIYHLRKDADAKAQARIIDHCAIFVLIAGSYTPFALGALKGAWGWGIFGFQWGMAVAGILLKVFAGVKYQALSVAIYLLMGWSVVVAWGPMVDNLPAAAINWLVAGGICYTVGVVFYVLSAKLKFSHFIWHLWVAAGSACHFLCVWSYA